MIHLQVNAAYETEIDAEQIRNACQVALEHLGEGEAEITLVLENDAFLHQLNQQYRGIDAPTDVLSFELNYFNPETSRRYLGDIAISLDTAKRQARRRQLRLADELCLLTIHGVLHLLAYDHATPEEENEMWRLQREILEALGISGEIPFD